jgi:hypothetical protein
MYYDFYLYTDEFWDFDKAFEVTKTLVASVDPEQLTGYNFNRYTLEGEDREPHITVRLNLGSINQLSKVTEKLHEMNSNEDIDDFSDNNPLVRPFREYSINHRLAHEASTQCAFKFYDKKKQNQQEFQVFTRNKVVFLREFIPLWLKYSGFVFQGVANVTSSSSTLIEELAKECGAIVGSIEVNQITDIHVLSERLIHIFMNCVCVPRNEEVTVLRNLASRFGYNNLQEFLSDLTL